MKIILVDDKSQDCINLISDTFGVKNFSELKEIIEHEDLDLKVSILCTIFKDAKIQIGDGSEKDLISFFKEHQIFVRF